MKNIWYILRLRLNILGKNSFLLGHTFCVTVIKFHNFHKKHAWFTSNLHLWFFAPQIGVMYRECHVDECFRVGLQKKWFAELVILPLSRWTREIRHSLLKTRHIKGDWRVILENVAILTALAWHLGSCSPVERWDTAAKPSEMISNVPLPLEGNPECKPETINGLSKSNFRCRGKDAPRKRMFLFSSWIKGNAKRVTGQWRERGKRLIHDRRSSLLLIERKYLCLKVIFITYQVTL